jgi:DNA mismatch repair protein MutS2
MNPQAYRALEFDRIREALAAHTSTPLGRDRALTLEPSTETDEVAERLALTSEAVAFVARNGQLALDAPDDLAATLDGLAVPDEPLLPLQLLSLARFVDSVLRVVAGVRSAERERPDMSRLAAVVSAVQPFDDEVRAIRRAIEPGGEIADNASPALRDIRDQLRRQRAKLRSTLEGITRGRDTAKYLQDQIVTDRNGRYVIVMRAEHREAIPGIVHGTSASGASLYVEPLSTVELNNDVVALAEREKEEIYRILTALSSAFRRRGDDLDALLAAAAEVDELQAKAQLSVGLDATAPALSTDGRVDFRGARHPLLVLQQKKPGFVSTLEDTKTNPGIVVASDLTIAPPATALVISGPNTGGKTVALKAFGLLALMAQSGLLIPVEPGSAFTPFASIFADIGDDQSIAASLSTFSARIATLVGIERDLLPPALVLLDEVGSGTDPVEGGALGAAVIDHLRRRGATIVATTHDDALKSYAATTEGVAAAAFGFDTETYAPTYRLRYGAPGRSLAIEIAKRLGMPADVIADARARQTGRESQLAAHLARVDRELAALDAERLALVAERNAVTAERQQIRERETRLVEREAVLKKRLDDKLNEKLREARAEVDAVVSRLKSKADTLAQQAEQRVAARAPVLSTGEVGSLRAEARAALGTIGHTIAGASPPEDEALNAPPAAGQSVFVTSIGAEGIVRGVSGKQVDVEVRGKRMRVPFTALRAKPPGARAAAPATAAGRRRDRAPSGALTPGPAAELVLIGATVDEAIDRLEKFLDSALLGDERRIRVVHGHGTGKLREAVRAHLRNHPLVAHVAPAPDNEGGQGATVAELKD